MNKAMKNFSLILFASSAWMACAVMLPASQAQGTNGLMAKASNLIIGQAYADDNESSGKSGDDGNNEGEDESHVTLCHVPPGNPDNQQTLQVGESAVSAHLTEHPGDYLGACVPDKKVSTCVALSQLSESIGKDKADEQDKADAEYKARDDEEHYASTERDEASSSQAKGDKAGYDDHESKAKSYDDQAKEHEDKGKEYEDKSKGYADTKNNVDELHGNCTAVVQDAATNTPKSETGVWVPANPDYVSNALDQNGGASELVNLISSDNGATVANAAGESSMESYREIRGQ